SNYVITQCLGWHNEVKKATFKWFEQRLALLQTHYLFVAWLENGLEPAEIRLPLARWLDASPASGQHRFKQSAKASFVYYAWLNAVTGGGKQSLNEQDRVLVEQPIRDWLDAEASQDAQGKPIANRLRPDAQFVYYAWLDAVTGGGKQPLNEQDR